MMHDKRDVFIADASLSSYAKLRPVSICNIRLKDHFWRKIEDAQRVWNALPRIWHNMTERRMYVTGGVGSRYSGESFGKIMSFRIAEYTLL